MEQNALRDTLIILSCAFGVTITVVSLVYLLKYFAECT